MSASVSPLPYIGNKGCLAEPLLAIMPPHSVYIEPCMGSAEIFFRKKPAPLEILNDFNGDLVRLFRVLQDNRNMAYLLGRICMSQSSELLFQMNQRLLDDTPNILDDMAETSRIVQEASWEDVQLAAAFFERQVFSFSSGGSTFGIASRDMARRLMRFFSANRRLQNAVILHRDYKDVINYGAGPDCYILLDPPYKGTESYYRKANFDITQHQVLFSFMAELHDRFGGSCKFTITYNDDPDIRALAEKERFQILPVSRLDNMRQGKEAGAQYSELLISNYDMEQQAKENRASFFEQNRQLSLFDEL